MKMTNKSKQGMPLHQFIGSGGNVSNYQQNKGLNGSTVPNIKSKDKK